jgi:hypothetical protein
LLIDSPGDLQVLGFLELAQGLLSFRSHDPISLSGVLPFVFKRLLNLFHLIFRQALLAGR